ncbi:hypothetical protein EGW08_008770, partial [Elysia chlorotica]
AGGFGLPFYLTGGLTLALDLAVVPVLPDISDIQTPKQAQQTGGSVRMSVLLLARSGLAVAGMLGLVTSAVGNSFLQPVLATHLQTFGLSTVMIGLCFALNPIIYTLCTPALGFLTDRLNIKELLLLISSLGCCVAFTLMGPSPFVSFLPRQLWLVVLGYVICGVSEAGLTIPTGKCLVSGAREMGFPNDMSTHGMMSGCSLSGFHFGAFVGPLLAGTLTDAVGFGRSTSIVAIIYLSTFVIFCLIFGYRYKVGHGESKRLEEASPI